MEPLEKMSHEEAKRFTELAGKIAITIEGEEAEYTYQDVMRAIDAIKNNYEKKGRNLLNDKSIKEVSRYGALLS